LQLDRVLVATGQYGSIKVEDEATVRIFASRALQLHGYKVIEACSGEEALAKLNDQALEIDIFVTDVVMPRKDGPTWMCKALEKRPKVRIVFVYGRTEDSFDAQ
jgi:two-component system cell cycle sensor histidine kinase/response regulator CckA